MTPPDRRIPGWALPVGLAVLVIALVTIALARDPVSYDPGTPEGTVQEYLLAISEERWDEAIEIVHEDWRGSCEGSDLAMNVHDEFTARLGDQTGGLGASSGFSSSPDGLTGPTVPEGATSVEVTLEHGDTGGLGSGWTELTVFEMIEEEGFWWVVGDPWPYFAWTCRGGT